ncbi:hypothetical protein NX059_003317 [Plenodomus lindquistii]|nr:hypothetical protein NX059_003317 [Plenodomus lindquistii]
MVLTIHHLGLSQSERILLLEEMGMTYTLIKHTRDPTIAPASLKSLPGNTTGQSPFIADPETNITLSESGAICQYIMEKYKKDAHVKKMYKEYGDQGYEDYIYFFHFANATLQPVMAQIMVLGLLKADQEQMMVKYAHGNMHRYLKLLDTHLEQHKWLAGDDFTAADCMIIYSLTTKRYFGPLVSYAEYPNLLRYLKDVGERPAYQRAMEKGDPEMQPLLGAEPPEKSLIEVGGMTSDLWKKKKGASSSTL